MMRFDKKEGGAKQSGKRRCAIAWISREGGQTMAEWSLIFTLVVITTIVTLISVGNVVLDLWTSFIDAWPA